MTTYSRCDDIGERAQCDIFSSFRYSSSLGIELHSVQARRDYYAFANTTKYSIGVDWSWLDSCDGSPRDCSCELN